MGLKNYVFHDFDEKIAETQDKLSNILLYSDYYFSNFPIELLPVSETSDEFWGTKFEVMKELKNFNCSTLVTKNEIPKIAIVCRPNSQKVCLDNAAEEAEKIYEILTAENLKDKIEVADPIFEIDFSGFYKILNNNFDLIHFIGHGFAENTKAGFVLNEEEEFTDQDLRKLDKAPRLIFANSCYSSKGSKINLAQRFVRFGTENFVGTLASVSDSESKDFSIKFWEFFSQGNTISRSLFLSRRYFFTQNKNIWAYYTGFGKGKFRLKIE